MTKKTYCSMFTALCAVFILATAAPSDARPRRGHSAHHITASHVTRHATKHGHRRPAPQQSTVSNSDAIDQRYAPIVEQATPQRATSKRAARTAQQAAPASSVLSSFGGSSVVATARSYLGSGPKFGRSSLWCANFMNYVLKKAGYHDSGSNMASSFAHYGNHIAGPVVGAIAYMGRRGGGHVGVVSGIATNGDPIIISGNHNRRVAESQYPRSRINGYTMPNG